MKIHQKGLFSLLFILLLVSCAEAAVISAPSGEINISDSSIFSVSIAGVDSAEGISFTPDLRSIASFHQQRLCEHLLSEIGCNGKYQ
jgi:hypothetical protein